MRVLVLCDLCWRISVFHLLFNSLDESKSWQLHLWLGNWSIYVQGAHGVHTEEKDTKHHRHELHRLCSWTCSTSSLLGLSQRHHESGCDQLLFQERMKGNTPGGGGILPYMGHIGMCGPKRYGFQPFWS